MKNGDSSFSRFWKDASYCDAVIFTSPLMVNTDPAFFASNSSMEALLGESVRRLGYAALDQAVLDQIPGAGCGVARHKPRLFALGTATLSRPDEEHPTADLGAIFDTQYRFVDMCFGEVLGGGRFQFVTNACSHWSEILSREGPVFNLYAPSYRTDDYSREQGGLDLLTLWPFDFDAEAEIRIEKH